MCHRTGRVEVAQGCGQPEQCAMVEVGKRCGDKETRPRHQAHASKNRDSVRVIGTTESDNRVN
jgi:hypothetical protein